MKEYKYTEGFSSVPLDKLIKENQKEVFDQWMPGQMKPITKYGGMPKPAGCV